MTVGDLQRSDCQVMRKIPRTRCKHLSNSCVFSGKMLVHPLFLHAPHNQFALYIVSRFLLSIYCVWLCFVFLIGNCCIISPRLFTQLTSVQCVCNNLCMTAIDCKLAVRTSNYQLTIKYFSCSSVWLSINCQSNETLTAIDNVIICIGMKASSLTIRFQAFVELFQAYASKQLYCLTP